MAMYPGIWCSIQCSQQVVEWKEASRQRPRDLWAALEEETSWNMWMWNPRTGASSILTI